MADDLIDGRSVGARSPDQLTDEQLGRVKTFTGIERLGVTPLLRTTGSVIKSTRGIASRLMESSVLTHANKEGISAAPLTGAVETRIKTKDALLGVSLQNMDQIYIEYRKAGSKLGRLARDLTGQRAKSGDLSPREFRPRLI